MKKRLAQATIVLFVLSSSLRAQEAIEIEIDSAPVEIEVPQPSVPEQQQPSEPEIVQTEPQEPEQQPEDSSKVKKYGLAIGIGALVAGALAALAGGGGGGTSSTPSH